MKLFLMAIFISFMINMLILMPMYFIEKYNIKRNMELLYPTDYGEITKVTMEPPITVSLVDTIYIKKENIQ